MIRLNALGLVAAAVMAATAAGAQAQTAAPATAAAPAAAWSSKTTPIGDLLDNPATKAVLLKHIPDVVNNPQIEQGRPFTLEAIVQYAPSLTPEVLAAIDADLAKVPPKG